MDINGYASMDLVIITMNGPLICPLMMKANEKPQERHVITDLVLTPESSRTLCDFIEITYS